jgi:hypothetical protein
MKAFALTIKCLTAANWRHSAVTREYRESSHPPAGVKPRWKAYYDWTSIRRPIEDPAALEQIRRALQVK